MKAIKICALLLAIGSVAVADSNNRIYMAVRPQLANMPLAQATFYSHANNDNPSFGGTWQATTFFEQSTERDKAGKYFSFTDNNSFAIKGSVIDPLNIADASVDALPGNFALDRLYDGVISFRPQRTSYGVHLNYQQELNHVAEALYFTFSAPVVSVEHTLGMQEKITTNPNLGAATFTDVMAGKRLNADFAQSVQAARITGKNRVVGLADVRVGLGKRFLQTDAARVQGHFSVTVPTGNEVTGTSIFEPIVGNGGHWGLGCGLQSRLNVWKNEDNEDHRCSIWVMGDVNYLFRATQTRLIGFAGKQKSGAQFARMRQQDPAAVPNLLPNFLPGANVMTRGLHVTPGVQAEGLVWADYTWNAFKLGVGYDIFARQREWLDLRDDWYAPGTYGLVSRVGGVDSGSTIKINATTAPGGGANGQFITPADLDLLPCKAAVSHKFASQISYVLNTDNPSYVGLGGGYEFAGNNDLLSMWQAWAKFGISF